MKPRQTTKYSPQAAHWRHRWGWRVQYTQYFCRKTNDDYEQKELKTDYDWIETDGFEQRNGRLS